MGKHTFKTPLNFEQVEAGSAEDNVLVRTAEGDVKEVPATSFSGSVEIKGEFTNNGEAIGGGLVAGDIYNIPINSNTAAAYLAIVRVIPEPSFWLKFASLPPLNSSITDVNDLSQWTSYFNSQGSVGINLTSVEVTGNKVEFFGNLDNISSLKCFNSNMVEYFVSNLTSLQTLNLQSNQITTINGLDTLTSLQTLTLQSNQITTINGLDNLTSLQTLDLSSNQITTIEGLESLTSLQNLYLSSNQITTIQGLDSLILLNILSINSNQITTINGLDFLTSLEYLNLASNQISTIEGLDSLTSLRYLYLGSNQITTIEGLDSLILLIDLSLDSNQISTIEGLDSLILLRRLYLNSNQITTIQFNNLNSWAVNAITNVANIINYYVINTSNNIDNFNTSTTYTTIFGKGWTIYN
jgi:Leucine-rich repeat (LRR) protein